MTTTEHPTREERMAERQRERQHRLANPKAARYERFLNDFQSERFHAETDDHHFMPKDARVESHVFWDGEGAARQ